MLTALGHDDADAAASGGRVAVVNPHCHGGHVHPLHLRPLSHLPRARTATSQAPTPHGPPTLQDSPSQGPPSLEPAGSCRFNLYALPLMQHDSADSHSTQSRGSSGTKCANCARLRIGRRDTLRERERGRRKGRGTGRGRGRGGRHLLQLAAGGVPVQEHSVLLGEAGGGVHHLLRPLPCDPPPPPPLTAARRPGTSSAPGATASETLWPLLRTMWPRSALCGRG